MKLTFKLIAAAVALVAASGANAALTSFNTGNGSISLYAFNTETGAYYIRDTGLLLNSFLPNSIGASAAEGNAAGTATPSTGLTVNSTSNTSFADSAFATWFGGQTAESVLWALVGGDALLSGGVSRVMTTGASGLTWTDGQVTNAVAGANLGSLITLFGNATLSRSANSGAPAYMQENGGLGVETLTAVGQSASLYYIARSAPTGFAGAPTNQVEYGNGAGYASVTLTEDGQLSYVLGAESVSAVPVPAAVWLLGSGLLGAGGFIRRRKAAAAAQA